MAKPTYSDRDYFDNKFKQIDTRFDDLDVLMDKIHCSIYGNGHVGLIEQVRKNQSHIKMAFSILAGMTPIYIKESRDVIIGMIKSIIGIL